MPLTQVQGGMLQGSTNTTTTIQSNGTTAITIDSTQKVGIGTASPSAKLHVTQSGNPIAQFTRSDSGTGLVIASDSDGPYFRPETPSAIRFNNSGNTVENMRIDSSGRVQIGTTATSPASSDTYGIVLGVDGAGGAYAGASQFSTNGTAAIQLNRGGDNGTTMSFRRSGTTVGAINVTTSSTAYVTSSDYRLKENIAPMTGALDKVSALKPCTYTWKSTGGASQGFIAHELSEVVPDCVTGTKDGMRTEQYEVSPAIEATYDEEGNELTPAVEAVMGEREVPDYQGIDTSFLVATLTAAIQELKAELDSVKAELAALKATP